MHDPNGNFFQTGQAKKEDVGPLVGCTQEQETNFFL